MMRTFLVEFLFDMSTKLTLKSSAVLRDRKELNSHFKGSEHINRSNVPVLFLSIETICIGMQISSFLVNICIFNYAGLHYLLINSVLQCCLIILKSTYLQVILHSVLLFHCLLVL